MRYAKSNGHALREMKGADGGQIRNLIARNRAMSQPERVNECPRADYIRRPDEKVITQNRVLGRSGATILYVYRWGDAPGVDSPWSVSSVDRMKSVTGTL